MKGAWLTIQYSSRSSSSDHFVLGRDVLIGNPHTAVSITIPSSLMDDNDDDFFSDDGFDSLPPATLLKLEQDAIARRETQQPTNEHLNTARNNASDPQKVSYPSVYGDTTSGRTPRLYTGSANEYGGLEVGELDAEVFDGDDQSFVALEEQLPVFENGPAAQHWQATENIQPTINDNVTLQQGFEQRLPQPNADRMEIEDEYTTGQSFDNDLVQNELYDSHADLEQLNAYIREVSLCFPFRLFNVQIANC